MSAPNSTIYVLSDVPLNNSYEHSLYFANELQQQAYFLGHTSRKTLNNFSYLRQEQAIKIAGDIVNARNWNYLVYENDVGKLYYNFITRVEYVSDNTVKLHIELDVLQTYMFDWDMHQCFIEREHTSTDNFGEHTIDEGLEPGPLIDEEVVNYNFDDLCIMMLSAVTNSYQSDWSKVYDGVFSGLAIHAIDIGDYAELGSWLDNMSTQGKIDAIVSMWMYPKDLVLINGAWTDGFRHSVKGYSNTEIIHIPEKIGSTIDGYTPKNKKVFCFPYTMLYVSNNLGTSAMLKREKFSTDDYSFKIMGALAPDAGVQIAPRSYNGNLTSYEDGLAIDSFPTCAWDSDTYKVWLAQNMNSLQKTQIECYVKAGGAIATELGALATMNLPLAVGGVSMATSGLKQAADLMAQVKDMEVQPPQARGNQSGNINIANNKCGFAFHFKTITAEYARSIDNFFSRYGYKVNRIATPSLCNRGRFTYIKTVGCFVTGNIGAEDQLKIQAIFDKGITWWKDHSTVGNFTSANPCL